MKLTINDTNIILHNELIISLNNSGLTDNAIIILNNMVDKISNKINNSDINRKNFCKYYVKENITWKRYNPNFNKESGKIYCYKYFTEVIKRMLMMSLYININEYNIKIRRKKLDKIINKI